VGVAALIARSSEDATARRQRLSGGAPSPWDATDGFEYTGKRQVSYDVLADGQPFTVPLSWGGGTQETAGDAEAIPAGDDVLVWHKRRQIRMRWPERKSGGTGGGAGDGALRAPMPGKLTKLMVRLGDKVARGDRLAIVEAMKMEHVLHAPADGEVTAVPYAEGEQVDMGAVIAELRTGEA
jgi:3-methylcrotonyl-CoA carboxylase alpha subunit